MIFPYISHLDQIEKAIEGRPEFIIAERDGYYVANYMVAYDDTFPPIFDKYGVWDEKAAILRECRGLMFDRRGDLISRPLHKFFNVNQIPEVAADKIDLSKPHVILDKLDGSMIRPVNIDGEIRLCTKMGITEQSLMVENWLDCGPLDRRDNYYDLFEFFIKMGITPIFEFCSRKNQIVLDYPEDMLVLIAVRGNWTGSYEPYENLLHYGLLSGVPVVGAIGVPSSGVVGPIITNIRDRKDCEGIVIRFDDGQMMKVKSDWYCERHHAKDSILLEKNLLKLHLEEKLDDIVPLLDQAMRDRVTEYTRKVNEGITRTNISVDETIDFIRQDVGHVRADQAGWLKDNVENPLRAIMFSALDGRDVRRCIVNTILKNTSSSTKIDSIRSLFNANWIEPVVA